MKNTATSKQSPKAISSPENIVKEYKKLVSDKLKAGMTADAAETFSFRQIEHDYGQKAASEALIGIVSEAAASSRASDPFKGFGRVDVPLGTHDQTAVKARAITLPPNFRKLVYEKRKAGLSSSQAEAVVRAQIGHDAQLAETVSEAAASAEEPKKPAKA